MTFGNFIMSYDKLMLIFKDFEGIYASVYLS